MVFSLILTSTLLENICMLSLIKRSVCNIIDLPLFFLQMNFIIFTTLKQLHLRTIYIVPKNKRITDVLDFIIPFRIK